MKKGEKVSKETRAKMSKAQKGRIVTTIHREKLRQANLGKKQSAEVIAKRVNARNGYRHSEETKRKIGEKHKGEKCFFWKGGVSASNRLIRESIDYRLWRKSVFERDGYMCIWGGKSHGNKLNADHIKPFALYPELRFAIDNGRTLCEPCHRSTDTYGKWSKK